MPFTDVPLLSASLGLAFAYPPSVGLLGSFASKRGLLRVPSPLPAPDEASDPMLAFRGRGYCALPSSASFGVAVRLGTRPSAEGISVRLVRSSGYGNGPVGGGDVGAPYDAALLEGGTL